MANSVSVLLPAYRRTLTEKYRGEHIHYRAHGILSAGRNILIFPGAVILIIASWRLENGARTSAAKCSLKPLKNR